MFIEFEKIINARELGGIKTADGRHVKHGVLLRTAELTHASDRDLERLSGEYKIKHIFDFRDISEVSPRPDREIPGAEYHFLPVLPCLPGGSDTEYSKLTPKRVFELFQGMYRTMAEDEVSIKAYSEFFRVLLSSGGGAALWHCTQGKDRTGVAGILLLTALGVPKEAAVEDYYLSNVPMGQEYEQYVKNRTDEKRLEFLKMMLFVMPGCLNEFFHKTQELYGGAEGYLRQRLGLTDAGFTALREYYTE